MKNFVIIINIFRLLTAFISSFMGGVLMGSSLRFLWLYRGIEISYDIISKSFIFFTVFLLGVTFVVVGGWLIDSSINNLKKWIQ